MINSISMARNLCSRFHHVRRSTNYPLISATRTNMLPNALPIPENTTDNDMLRNLRIAVTPSYGYGSTSYSANTCSTTSSLAGDPKRLEYRQDIRAEILEKWDRRPKPDIHKEWLKNIMFN